MVYLNRFIRLNLLISTVDLSVQVACFAKKLYKIFNTKGADLN